MRKICNYLIDKLVDFLVWLSDVYDLIRNSLKAETKYSKYVDILLNMVIIGLVVSLVYNVMIIK